MKHKIRCMLMIAMMIQTCFIPMSCMTVETYKGSDLNELQITVDQIKTIYLKSGERISCEDSGIRFLKSPDNVVYGFARGAFDTTWSADKKNYSVSASADTIRLDDVRQIIVKDANVTQTILAVLGIAAGVLLIVAVIAAGNQSWYGN